MSVGSSHRCVTGLSLSDLGSEVAAFVAGMRPAAIEDHFEAAPAPGSAPFQPDVAAELACEASTDRQPHPESRRAVGFVVVDLIKLVEQECSGLFRDADAGV